MKKTLVCLNYFRAPATVLFIFLLFVSCQKSKTVVDILTERTNILTTGSWRFTGYTFRSAISTVYYSNLLDCRKDDLRFFKPNGTVEVNEGLSKCNIGNPQSIIQNWRFSDDHARRIQINSIEYIVDRLDNIEFSIHTYNTDPYAPQTSYGFSK